tara:strand:+ start:1530 stop:2144 length:615 start_codon:yes stop_codon:yes gene_type:complete
MSFRLEKKFTLDTRKYDEFIRYINTIDAKKIYNSRKVFSTYFENDFFSSFKQSEEGVVPRKKIRIRSYNTNNHSVESKLEVKISAEDSRFKKVEKIKSKNQIEKLLNRGLLDKNYGLCKPLLNVSYEREYYQLTGHRITIDKNIIYCNFKKKIKIFYEPLSIIEFKSETTKDINLYDNILTSPISRFSKYCRGMNKVFFNVKNF